MSPSRLTLAALMLTFGCARAPAAPAQTPEPGAAAATAEPDAPEAEPEPESDAPDEPESLARNENTQVLEIEADDLGGGPEAIVAEPKRPAMPSMMNDIRLGPSP